MIEQKVMLSLEGEDKTKESSDYAISATVNRFYDVATFTLSFRPETKSVVKLETGFGTFDGFVYSCERSGRGKYRVECRSAGGLLTEPFFSSWDKAVEPAKTSHELCAYYTATFGVPIEIKSIDLDFGGDYERNSTPLQALATIASATGAEYWWDGSKIRIEPNKPVPQNGREIPLRDIFDFAPDVMTIENAGIGEITVGSVSSADEITTSSRCDVQIGECSSTVVLRIVPHGSFEKAAGIHSVREIIDDLQYSEIMSNAISIRLDAQIDRIGKITVDGTEVNDYTFLFDTVVFSAPVRGRVTIDYLGYGYVGELETFMFGGEKRYRYDIYYGDCDVESADGTISCGGNMNSNGEKECDCATIVTPKEMNYIAGFTFRSLGCVPHISFTDGHTLYPGNVATTAANVPFIDMGYLSAYAGSPTEDARRHWLRKTPVSVEMAQSGGVNVPFSVDGQYVLFDKPYKDVIIAYTVAGHEHYVQFSNAVRGDLTMIVNGCEYSIGGENALDPGSVPCGPGVRVAVDIAGELGADIADAKGKAVMVTRPDGAMSVKIVDPLGFVYVDNLQQGTYRFDTGNIFHGSWVKMYVNFPGENNGV